jgi:hypothetical protein
MGWMETFFRWSSGVQKHNRFDRIACQTPKSIDALVKSK